MKMRFLSSSPVRRKVRKNDRILKYEDEVLVLKPGKAKGKKK